MEIIVGTDPFALFQDWYDEAVKTEINDPDAIALASVDAGGMPSVRMVLLRRWSPDGFLFSPIMKAARRMNCLPPARRLLPPLEKSAASDKGCRRCWQGDRRAIG